MKQPKLTIAAALAAAVTVLVACSSGGSTSGAALSGKTSGPPIMIGLIAPTGTAAGNYDDDVAGAMAAARAIDVAGGVGRRPIEIDYCNESNDINKAAACARQLEASSDIAMVGAFSQFANQSILPNIKTIPDIGPIAISNPEVACPTCYTYDSMIIGEYDGTGALAAQAGIKTVDILGADVPAGHAAVAQVESGLQKVGVSVKEVVYVPLTASDVSSYALKLSQSDAQALIPQHTHQVTIAVLQALKQLGKSVLLVTNDSQLELADIKVLGSEVNGSYVESGLPPASAANVYPGIKEWIADMKAEQAAGDQQASVLDSQALHSWLGVRAIAEIAAQIHGTVNRASFTAALKSAKDISLQGILPPWTPTAPTPPGVAKGLVNPYLFFMRVENGNYYLIHNDPWNLSTGSYQPVS
jgi:ABC-type branched-subunit amino acid transport system substrate-binding protein